MLKTSGRAVQRPTHFEQISVKTVVAIAVVDPDPILDRHPAAPGYSVRVAPDRRQSPRAGSGSAQKA